VVTNDHPVAAHLPRLVIAAPASGHGKTTVATGLMAALARAGHVVSGHKVGPDYIDPGYHALATGRPGRNLDPHLVGEHRLAPLLLHGAMTPKPADIAIIEGVMGLHDGQIGGNGFASTAHVATLTQTPVILVVDISHASRSIAAMVQGMVAFDPAVRVVGVILNKAGSPRHAHEVVSAMESTGLPVLGVLQRDDGIVAPSRHLGLIPADERADAAQALDRLAAQIAEHIDLDEVLRLARDVPTLDAEPWDPTTQVSAPSASDAAQPVVAMAGGRAFTFRYAETEELLAAAGCRVEVFDPLTDTALPEGTAGLYLGGGFPEVHAAGLAANADVLHALRDAVAAGMPTVAECAGLLYLCRTVDGVPMVGALEADAQMAPRLTLSYRTAIVPHDQLTGPAGTRVTGHEFHRTTTSPAAGAMPAWLVDGQPHGTGTDSISASYLHTHWAGHPHVAQRFADAVHSFAARPTPDRVIGSEGEAASRAQRGNTPARSAARAEPWSGPWSGPEARAWHGDQETSPDLVDFAVNVNDEERPTWLDDALRASLSEVGAYPHTDEAERAVGRRHGRRPDEVLATAGVAEAFTLIARSQPWKHPVVVHPQFTEPDVALAAAGYEPHHVITTAETGFALDSSLIPEAADLVVIGNPTNPTGTLHPEQVVRRLLAPGRLVVVDEAFMDAVPGERGSLSSVSLPGLIVLRSLTKTWSIPGVRAGYALGHPATLQALRRQQPLWSVSAQAVAALIACSTDEATAEQARRAGRTATHRAVLVDGLTELGITQLPSAGPFVLAQLGVGAHQRLRDAGYALRRADTFPGLDDSWCRIAVRRPDTIRKLLATLRVEGISR